MMVSNIEFYEALRAHMPDEVAKLIADRSPNTEDLATKANLDALGLSTQAEFRALRLEVKADLQGLRADIRGWMLSFFVPLWIGVYGTLAAVVVSLVVRG